MANRNIRRRLENFESTELPDLTRHFKPPEPSAKEPTPPLEPERSASRVKTDEHQQDARAEPAAPSPASPAQRAPAKKAAPKQAKAHERNPARTAGRRSPGRPPTREETDGSRSTTVTLPASIRKRFLEEAAARGLSNWGLIIDALESAEPEALSKEIAKAGGRAGGKRFAARTSSRAMSPPDEGSPTPINVRPLQADLEILEAMKDEFGARSRNQLVQAAVRLLLEG